MEVCATGLLSQARGFITNVRKQIVHLFRSEGNDWLANREGQSTVFGKLFVDSCPSSVGHNGYSPRRRHEVIVHFVITVTLFYLEVFEATFGADVKGLYISTHWKWRPKLDGTQVIVNNTS